MTAKIRKANINVPQYHLRAVTVPRMEPPLV
jgi:hypothetical protein